MAIRFTFFDQQVNLAKVFPINDDQKGFGFFQIYCKRNKSGTCLAVNQSCSFALENTGFYVWRQ
jgi:hypothetical protein